MLRRLRRSYDQLWLSGLNKIRAGIIELDPLLRERVPDRRRGLTLIARPSPAVRRTVTALLRALRRIEPDQYYYAAPEFHLTVLSLFTATVDSEPHFAQKEKYVAAVNAALTKVQPISICFEGVTASPGTVMIQGFFNTRHLDRLRDRLRRQLRERGLAKGLDERYKLQTAHMTVVRFRAELADPERFANALEKARRWAFGQTRITRFDLVRNDWYMSRHSTETLKRYPSLK